MAAVTESMVVLRDNFLLLILAMRESLRTCFRKPRSEGQISTHGFFGRYRVPGMRRVTTALLDTNKNANVGFRRGKIEFRKARKSFVLLVELTRIELVTS